MKGEQNRGYQHTTPGWAQHTPTPVRALANSLSGTFLNAFNSIHLHQEGSNSDCKGASGGDKRGTGGDDGRSRRRRRTSGLITASGHLAASRLRLRARGLLVTTRGLRLGAGRLLTTSGLAAAAGGNGDEGGRLPARSRAGAGGAGRRLGGSSRGSLGSAGLRARLSSRGSLSARAGLGRAGDGLGGGSRGSDGLGAARLGSSASAGGRASTGGGARASLGSSAGLSSGTSGRDRASLRGAGLGGRDRIGRLRRRRVRGRDRGGSSGGAGDAAGVDAVLRVELHGRVVEDVNEGLRELLGNLLSLLKGLGHNGVDESVGVDADRVDLLARNVAQVVLLNHIALGHKSVEQRLALALEREHRRVQVGRVEQVELVRGADRDLAVLERLHERLRRVGDGLDIASVGVDGGRQLLDAGAGVGHDAGDGRKVALVHPRGRVDDAGRDAGHEARGSEELHG